MTLKVHVIDGEDELKVAQELKKKLSRMKYPDGYSRLIELIKLETT